MRLSSRAANPVGAGFVLCSANRGSAPDIAHKLLPYLAALPIGAVMYEGKDGVELPVTNWEEYLQLIAEGTPDLAKADFAAEAIAAGCVVAHEIIYVEEVRPHIQQKLHEGLAKLALNS